MNVAVRRLRDPVVAQFVRYGVVGATNTAVFFISYWLLLQLDVNYLVASAVGYTLGSINGYILNRRWTFQAGHVSVTRSARRYTLVQLIALGANVGLLYAVVDGLGAEKKVGQVIVIVIVQIVSFLAHRAWSFAHRHEELGEPEVSPPVIVPPAA
jgi:putative flippase GtrA